jgi:hypothetical protein
VGGGGTDHFGEPAKMCRPPVRLPFVADILAQQEGFEPVLGGFEIADGVLPRTREIPDGLVLDVGNVDRGKVPRTHEAGELHGIAPVGLDLVAGLLRDKRGGQHPAWRVPMEPR